MMATLLTVRFSDSSRSINFHPTIFIDVDQVETQILPSYLLPFICSFRFYFDCPLQYEKPMRRKSPANVISLTVSMRIITFIVLFRKIKLFTQQCNLRSALGRRSTCPGTTTSDARYRVDAGPICLQHVAERELKYFRVRYIVISSKEHTQTHTHARARTHIYAYTDKQKTHTKLQNSLSNGNVKR